MILLEELVQTDNIASVSNKDACKSVSSDQQVDNDQIQDKNMTQIEVQIESGPQSLRKIECTHCKNYIYIYKYKLQNFDICAYDICKIVKL